ncbi:MAG: T9SS type A sorting domain-containing protein [Dysgonamonadaceae bacterium]|jgi:hypothetical protein|nr:T9SS type A sorting domain-containing protein [Dysgonamonadaceae bacterium]
MKHFYFLLFALFSLSNAYAQKAMDGRFAPESPVAGVSEYADAAATDDVTLSWLTSETMATSYGNGSAKMNLAAFMEVEISDYESFNGTGKNPETIKSINFYLAASYVSNITELKAVIRQGNTLATSTVVYEQATTVAGGWNYVDLTTPYTIDKTKNLYIGYQVVTSGAGYPLAVSAGTNSKQAWVISTSTTETVTNIVSDQGYSYNFIIKAVATASDAYANGIILKSVDIPSYAIVNDEVEVKGVVQNIGSQPLTSFTAQYSVDGGAPVEYHATGLNVALGSTYSFTFPTKFKLTEAKTYSFNVAVSLPNEDANGIGAQKTLTSTVSAYANIVQRVVLHESFTSSTCGPCKAGNENLLSVLNSVDETKWANIRYQMYWPSTGDPYFTMEGYSRKTFYGVSSVPELEVDGNQFNNHPGNLSVALFNQFAAIPAAATASASAEIAEKTVKAKITFTPVTTLDVQNLRIFAAIAEKTTTKNKKTNGETLFHNVMKKFLTSADGNAVPKFENGVPVSFDYEYTFNGEYRLPAAAVNSSGQYIGINNDTENSVEDFSNLIVVYWIQNIQNKDVLQAGKVDVSDYLAIGAASVSPVNVYPTLSNGKINVATPASATVKISDLSGRTLATYKSSGNLTVDLNYANGIYLVIVESGGQTSVKKIILTK